jgi:ferredoxin
MKEAGYIAKDAWKSFVDSLTKKYRVFAPVKEGDTITFQPLAGNTTPCLDRPAQGAPKAAIFPQSETLFTFTFKKDPSTPTKMEVELAANTDAADTVILCARPCDAKGATVLDPVYTEIDPYYRSRREKTTVISLACPNAYPGCFCTSVEGGPADKTGSDVLITELDNGYYVETVTDKGAAALKDANLQDGASHKAEAEKRQAAATASVKKAFDGGKAVKISPELFQSDEFWQEVSNKCLSCGACTYICPTCYCFNITDEQGISAGERVRSWDSCMFPHFTLEASTHNPRPNKFQRLKNRIGHKFSYYREKYGELACSGCGRCIRHCPVSVEISKIVALLAGENGKGGKAQDKE